MHTTVALLWLAAKSLQCVETTAAFSSSHHHVVSIRTGATSTYVPKQTTALWSSRDYDGGNYYGNSLFGNSDYYGGRGGRGSGSEDFRQVSRGDRYRRRENLRSGRYDNGGYYGTTRVGSNNNIYGRERGYISDDYRMGGGSGRMQDYYTPKQREIWQQRDNQGARYGWQQQYDTNRGNVRAGPSNDFRRGSALARIQDFFTPKQREMQQQYDNDGARYGWQQQYNTDRGNVRSGSSNDFRRGSAYSRMQDYYTPKQREIWQRNDNQGARYGWQQQYDTSRGNVRAGSSNDFRRGSSRDRYQDFATPREREMRQMRDNRELSRRSGGGSYGNDSYSYYGYGRDDGYGYGSRDDDYYYDSGASYDDDVYRSRGNTGAQRRGGAWGGLRGLFQ